MKKPSERPSSAIALLLLAAVVLAACGGDNDEGEPPSTDQRIEGDANVTGVVTYRGRIAMPPKARVEVTLENISTDDPASVVIGRQSISDAKNPPIPFDVSYDSGTINEDASYGVKATIFKGDDPWMINRDTTQVITGGNPTSDVQVTVEPLA